MRPTIRLLFKPSLSKMALHPPQNTSKLICKPQPTPPPTSFKTHPPSRARKRQNQLPSRPIHQRRLRHIPTRSQESLHPIPHLVHARPAQRRAPTRNRLPLHLLPALRPRLLPLRLPQRTRHARIRHLLQLRDFPKSERYRKQQMGKFKLLVERIRETG